MTLQTKGYWALATILGLIGAAAGCGSGAAERATTPSNTTELEPQGSSSTVRRGPTLSSSVRTSQGGPQDPPAPRPSTKEGCDACQGLWGAHGIEADETCICKTQDEGRECLDGTACEGECLLNDDAEFYVMDQGNPPRGYYKGHCASYDTTFGCFRHIPADIGNQLPLSPEEAGPFICVD